MVSLRMLNEKGATQVAPLFSSAWRAEPRQLRYMGRVPPPAPGRSLVNGLVRLPDTRRLHGRGFTGTVRFAAGAPMNSRRLAIVASVSVTTACRVEREHQHSQSLASPPTRLFRIS